VSLSSGGAGTFWWPRVWFALNPRSASLPTVPGSSPLVARDASRVVREPEETRALGGTEGRAGRADRAEAATDAERAARIAAEAKIGRLTAREEARRTAGSLARLRAAWRDR
jgi:hypothetical protein